MRGITILITLAFLTAAPVSAQAQEPDHERVLTFVKGTQAKDLDSGLLAYQFVVTARPEPRS